MENIVTANESHGRKHTCQSCEAKYYDLRKEVALCPICGVEFDPEALLKSRAKNKESNKKAKERAAAIVEDEVIVEEDDALVVADTAIDSDQDEELDAELVADEIDEDLLEVEVELEE